MDEKTVLCIAAVVLAYLIGQREGELRAARAAADPAADVPLDPMQWFGSTTWSMR